MIHQIFEVKTKTEALPKIEAVRIAHLPRGKAAENARANRDHFWSPLTAGPYLVPISRWVE
jgi:hypothetical protein